MRHVRTNEINSCPQFGKVICNVCERPNHAALFCQRIKKDIKKASENTFPSKGNRNNKRDRDHKGHKSNKRRKYKSDDSDSSVDKKESKDKKKMEKSKIKITKQDSPSDDDDFDTHVFMLRGNDDDVILDDQDDSIMDPYWSQASTPSPNYDWNAPTTDLSEYFPYSSGPSSPSISTSEDEELHRPVKKIRTFSEMEYDYYIYIHGICRPHGYIPASMLPSTRGIHDYDCRCHTCYDWTKDPSISSNTGSSDRSTASHEAYEHQWDNWTANHSPHGTPDSNASTIATHSTWNSNDPLPDDGERVLAREYQFYPAHTYKCHNLWNQWPCQSIYANCHWKFANFNMPRYERQCIVSRVARSKQVYHDV